MLFLIHVFRWIEVTFGDWEQNIGDRQFEKHSTKSRVDVQSQLLIISAKSEKKTCDLWNSVPSLHEIHPNRDIFFSNLKFLRESKKKNEDDDDNEISLTVKIVVWRLWNSIVSVFFCLFGRLLPDLGGLIDSLKKILIQYFWWICNQRTRNSPSNVATALLCLFHWFLTFVINNWND